MLCICNQMRSMSAPAAMQISIEDFRQMTESVGMQLDDDSLLALFSRVRTAMLCCVL